MNRAMLREAIEQQAWDAGLTLIRYPFGPGIRAAYYRAEGSPAVAAVSTAVTDPREWNVCALHEFCHHLTCACDLSRAPRAVRRKFETLADRAMLPVCMPLEKIVQAYRAGARSAFEFAEYLEITEAFFAEGMRLYALTCGPVRVVMGCRLFFDPPRILPL